MQFVVIGGLLVGAHRIYLTITRPVIEVTREWADTLARDFELKAGHPPDSDERSTLVRDYVENEILHREAKKQGMEDDPRVRNLMILAEREKLEPVVADPSDAELEKMRAEEPGAFHFPAEISFEHVSFATGAEIPESLLDRLRAGEKPPVPDGMHLPNPLPKTWMPQVGHQFGADFAAAVSNCKVGEWTGPLKSNQGVHFVKLLTYNPPREMPMEQVRPALVSRWSTNRRKAVVTEKVEKLAKGYRIILPAEGQAK